MNAQLFKQVQEYFAVVPGEPPALPHPAHRLDMSKWWTKSGSHISIGGAALVLSGHSTEPFAMTTAEFAGMEAKANEVLGLTADEGDRLHNFTRWPARFVMRNTKYLQGDGSQWDEANAIARIDHFIATNGAE